MTTEKKHNENQSSTQNQEAAQTESVTLTPEEKNQISHRARALAGFQTEWEKRHNGTDQ